VQPTRCAAAFPISRLSNDPKAMDFPSTHREYLLCFLRVVSTQFLMPFAGMFSIGSIFESQFKSQANVTLCYLIGRVVVWPTGSQAWVITENFPIFAFRQSVKNPPPIPPSHVCQNIPWVPSHPLQFFAN
jgi:hypothetical protein